MGGGGHPSCFLLFVRSKIYPVDGCKICLLNSFKPSGTTDSCRLYNKCILEDFLFPSILNRPSPDQD